MIVEERVLFGTMDKNNTELLKSLIDKISLLEHKKRKTLSDYGILSIYQLIENNLVDTNGYTASQPTAEQIDSATEAQKEKYNKLIQLRDIIGKYNFHITLFDYKLTLFYERVENCIHALTVGETIERQLADVIGQQQAMEFMAKSNEGLLTKADVYSYQNIFHEASYNFGIGAQCYIYPFYQWLEIAAEQFSIPELLLLVNHEHSKMTTAIYTAKQRIQSVIVGTEAETTTKQNNLNNIFKAVAQYQVSDYCLNKRQLTELKQDIRAFKKGTPNTISFSLFELYYEMQEKIENDYLKHWNKV